MCLKDGNVEEYFTLNNTSCKLLVTRSLDREDISNFTLVTECHDLGSPSRSVTVQLCVTILDENDHSPLFAETQYQISVTEDLEEGSAILDLSASDKDAGLNGEIMYTLSVWWCMLMMSMTIPFFCRILSGSLCLLKLL